ncbi:inhibitor of apoptosis-promoting Bax1-domain-containing protein [Hyaloraphidium curvatum]|nr:inhibitor of apoptosis-promoting Bax1-domain-containing protein [Hyaloraphidium curvatum]
MASLLAGGVTKATQDNQTTQYYANPGTYAAPPADGQYPPPTVGAAGQYPPPAGQYPPPSGQYPPPPGGAYPQTTAPAYPPGAQPVPQQSQSAVVDMNGVQYAPPDYRNPLTSLKTGFEDDAARQKREAAMKLTEVEIDVRMKFLRKVYGILFAQLALTCAITAILMFAGGSFKIWLITGGGYWFPWVMLIVCIISMMCLFAKRHETPLNFILLAIFTGFEALSIGSIVVFYDTVVVLQAAITTTAVFVGLSIFTWQTKKDFSFLWPFLSGALMALIMAGFIQLFLPYNYWYNIVIAIVTALVFCGYIVYDTQMIMKRMSPEDYIPASVMLYLDILNLFLAFLRIFGSSK